MSDPHQHHHGQHDHGQHDHGQHDHGQHDHGQHDHGQHQHDRHQHDQHRHDHDHQTIRLAPAAWRLGRPVYRIGRRRFITELGRNTFAVAILGGLIAACSDEIGDSAVPVPPDSRPQDSTRTTAPTPTDPTDPTDPTAAPDMAGDEPAVDEGALRWSQVELGFVSAYVLVRGNEAAVIDTGTSGSTDQIGATLTTLGVTFDDVRHVVLTHRHPDHIGSLRGVIGRAAAAAVYAGAGDIDNIDAPVAVTAVGDGDDVFGLQVIETPGHTPGSISVLDTGIGLLIAGDALNGNDAGTEISGPNPEFSSDMATAEASVAKLAGFDFEIAAFGHGQPVTAGAGALVDALAAG